MKQSKYNPAVHDGTQQIRVLNGNILHWFENHPQLSMGF